MTPDQIRTKRKELGLTQAGFSALLGISKSYVTQLETGIKTADRATERLLAVLDVPGVVERLRDISASQAA